MQIVLGAINFRILWGSTGASRQAADSPVAPNTDIHPETSRSGAPCIRSSALSRDTFTLRELGAESRRSDDFCRTRSSLTLTPRTARHTQLTDEASRRLRGFVLPAGFRCCSRPRLGNTLMRLKEAGGGAVGASHCLVRARERAWASISGGLPHSRRLRSSPSRCCTGPSPARRYSRRSQRPRNAQVTPVNAAQRSGQEGFLEGVSLERPQATATSGRPAPTRRNDPHAARKAMDTVSHSAIALTQDSAVPRSNPLTQAAMA